MEYNELFARTELLLGSETMREIASKRVILFGVGGVGSWCAEGLIRSGITQLTIVDSDKVAVANINRQLPATTKTVGMLKVEVLRNRLIEINPNAQITSIPHIYCPESAESFQLGKYDYVIDAIDSLSNKLDLLCRASATNAVVFSSMGAGLRLDPQKIRVAEFKKVRGCKLAYALRQKLKKGETLKKPILCVYSEEINKNNGEDALANADENSSFRKARINGTMVQVTAVFGFTLSGLVVQDIVNCNSHKTLS
ncbi:MAG TPA: tRNA threonylcarbamoyladenosine dehydratase [Bacteroidales bacterium]|jgi:tRNA A37 threonylcarbamoyladenosine dehydratase|nr:tRNA threonylcarbamoyladenosine dehydratase [Bacteroidales bacterium]